MSNLSAAQAAQQGNRTGDGRYAEKAGADPGVILSGDNPLIDQSPVQVDEQLAELYTEKLRIHARLKSRRDHQHSLVGDDYRRRYQPSSGWQMSWAEVEERTRKVLDDPNGFRRFTFQSNMDDIDQLNGELAVVIGKGEELEAEYVRRGGWPRAFLAVGSDGHVHSSVSCSTCNKGESVTRFQWMTGYSDSSEDQIVADAGYRACTVCYPSAPVGDERTLPTKMFSDDEVAAQRAREERAKAKAARDEARVAKALTADGSEFVIRTEVDDPSQPAWRGREKFKTERAAMTWALNHAACRRGWGGAPHMEPTNQVRDESVRQILQAVAEKHDRTLADVQAEFDKKVAAKIRRDQW